MIVRRAISSRGPGRVLASLLLVWVSGAACLLHCATICAADVVEEASGHCATMAEEPAASCCCDEEPAETVEVEEGHDAVRGVSEASACCLLRAREAFPAPVPTSVDAPAVEPASVELPTLAAVEPPCPTDSALPIRNRGDTYLRCCVFLI